MLDDRVRAVLERLEREDADERARGLPSADRSRAVARTTGQFLFALVAPQWDCAVLEVGASRGYSSLWLAAGVRLFGGQLTSLENDPAKASAWRANIAEAGVEEWADLLEGDAAETIPAIRSDVSGLSSALAASRLATRGKAANSNPSITSTRPIATMNWAIFA